MSKKTRFRAYQLGTKGSSFSYSVDDHFTLIEARLNNMNWPHIFEEMKAVGCEYINCLHITSWDQDHCAYEELKLILEYLKPKRLEYPGYDPHTDNGSKCLKAINDYYLKTSGVNKIEVSPSYIDSLDSAEPLGCCNIVYNPIEESDNSNNNSVVQLFRFGRFTVLSLGDCEDASIAKRIIGSSIATNETDVLILAHHGADNGFTTNEFIKAVKPKIALCSSNYENQFDHPKYEVRKMLYEEGVTLYTTKTGDIVITCDEDNKVRAYNLIAGSEKISSVKEFTPRCTVPS